MYKPPYNYCYICGNCISNRSFFKQKNDKWLGFFAWLQFWKPRRICPQCQKEKNLV